MIERGSIWWNDFGEPVGSRPAKRRPVLVVQSNDFNRSRLATSIVAILTTDLRLASQPGNVFLPAIATGLPHDSVVNVTTLTAVNRFELFAPVGLISGQLLADVDRGLRRVLQL